MSSVDINCLSYYYFNNEKWFENKSTVISIVERENMLQFFNTREIASVIWIIVFLLLCLVSKKLRNFPRAMIEYHLRPKMVFPALIFLAIIAILVFLLSFSALWKWKFIKDIFLWFFFIGLAMCRSTLNFDIKHHYFKTMFFDSIKFTVIIEFLVSSFAFSLIAEIIIFPFIFLIMLMNTYSKNDPQQTSKNNIFCVLQSITGLLILCFTLKVAISEYKSLNGTDMLISFLLPIVFTILFIPITYVLTLNIEYKKLFSRMKSKESDNKEFKRWQQRLIFQTCGFSLLKVSIFKMFFASKTFRTMTKEEFTHLLNEFRSDYKERVSKRHL